ncbi:uncharacterized protein EI97DRAFT_471103 [Westerdykella ornata]|uniref:Uncharacterized protein n=1 Tax=Westerdykella ornata TaxID=318751 RepID=A0A6A6J5S8_WESOR|nr:uncharacterized protein EI97DRAFT_471103 [Westerdykella ornata]KAF2271547.1 hypothetical protein EI97DRAFT_471103 [Westerdykella ornata]
MPEKAAVTVSDKRDPEVEGRGESSGNWFSRRLRKPSAKQGREAEGICVRTEIELERPKTAPSTGTKDWAYATTDVPPLPRPLGKPPPLPRPESGVIRDVNAWLDASTIQPAPRIMGGIPYWREGGLVHTVPRSDVRYAFDIRPARPTTHGQQFKSFCRRAGKMQVRMPTLPRSQRNTLAQRKQLNRGSNTVPSLPPLPPSPVEAKPKIPEQKRPFRSKSLMELKKLFTPETSPDHGGSTLKMQVKPRDQNPAPAPQMRSSASSRFDNQEALMERRVNAVFGRTRAASHVGTMRSMNSRRGESVMSDAPTYSTGVPPPSYHSRAESIRSTSSFGCVDAMRETREHNSRGQTVPRNGGMREKFKKIAQKAGLSKRDG